jgi:hypothetical protein
MEVRAARVGSGVYFVRNHDRQHCLSSYESMRGQLNQEATCLNYH